MIKASVTIGGRSLSGDWGRNFIEVVVDREVNVTGRADIRFRDPQLELFGGVEVGEVLEVDATDEGGTTTKIFSGEVVVVELEQLAPGAERELLITGFDRSHRLAHVQLMKPAVDGTTVDLVRAAAKAADLPVDKTPPSAKTPYHPGRGTGLEVFEGLCARYGWEWCVDTDGSLSVQDDIAGLTGSKPALTYKYQDEVIQLSARIAGFAPGKVSVPFWDTINQKGSQEESKAKKPTGPLAKKVGSVPWQKPYVVSSDESAFDNKEAEVRATAYERRRSASSVVVNGRLGVCDPRLEIGVDVKITDAGALDDTHVVTSIRHVIGRSNAYSEFGTGRVRPEGIGAIGPPESPSAPPLAVGTVTKVLPKAAKGPDLGPVAVVKFAQLDAAYETCEARLLSLGGSKEHGFFVSPSVGAEVLVGYERGDLRYPIVLGGLHSAKLAPGKISEDDREVNTVRLRDAKGNELLFEHDKGEGTVTLSRGAGKLDKIVFDKERLKMTADKEIVIAVGDASLTMKKDGTIDIEGKDISVTAKGKLTTDSTQDTSLSSSGGINAKATQALGLEAGSTADLKGSGPVSIKGAMVQIN